MVPRSPHNQSLRCPERTTGRSNSNTGLGPECRESCSNNNRAEQEGDGSPSVRLPEPPGNKLFLQSTEQFHSLCVLCLAAADQQRRTFSRINSFHVAFICPDVQVHKKFCLAPPQSCPAPGGGCAKDQPPIIFIGAGAITKICSEIKPDLLAPHQGATCIVSRGFIGPPSSAKKLSSCKFDCRYLRSGCEAAPL